MLSTADPDTTLAGASLPTMKQQVVAWIIHRRVRITSMLFVSMVGLAFVGGARPHDLTDYRDPETIVGLALVLAGVALRSWSAGILHKISLLTTVGPYSLVRNPLYVGSFMMMVGFGALIDQMEIWLALTPLMVLFVSTVRSEERMLAYVFGPSWDEYVKSTPRFIPRRLTATTPGNWKLQQWIKNREYEAVSAACLGLVALQAWRIM